MFVCDRHEAWRAGHLQDHTPWEAGHDVQRHTEQRDPTSLPQIHAGCKLTMAAWCVAAEVPLMLVNNELRLMETHVQCGGICLLFSPWKCLWMTRPNSHSMVCNSTTANWRTARRTVSCSTYSTCWSSTRYEAKHFPCSIWRPVVKHIFIYTVRGSQMKSVFMLSTTDLTCAGRICKITKWLGSFHSHQLPEKLV